jgi:hypothetical protein
MSITGEIGVGTTATAFKGVVLRIDDGPRIALKIIVQPPATPG